MALTPGISGYVPTRNCIAFDYCFREAIQSLLPLCDEVVVCDSDSDDGTRALLDKMATEESKIRVINYPFIPAVGDRQWFDRWLNFARSHLRFSAQFQLDADEVLAPLDFQAMRDAALRGECRFIRQRHFYRSARIVTAYGAGRFARLAPTECYMPSHGEIPERETNIRVAAEEHPLLGEIFHYGALRRRLAFAAKQRFMLRTLEGMSEAELDRAEEIENAYPPAQGVTEFIGEHPKIAQGWLKERGWL